MSERRLFLFIEAASPKRHDLRRDGRCVLHATATGAQPWELYEFHVEGQAAVVEDPDWRRAANTATAFPRGEHLVLFELEIRGAFATTYGTDGQPLRRRWPAG